MGGGLLFNYFVIKLIFGLPGKVIFAIIYILGLCLVYVGYGLWVTLILGVVLWLIWKIIVAVIVSNGLGVYSTTLDKK